MLRVPPACTTKILRTLRVNLSRFPLRADALRFSLLSYRHSFSTAQRRYIKEPHMLTTFKNSFFIPLPVLQQRRYSYHFSRDKHKTSLINISKANDRGSNCGRAMQVNLFW